MSYDMIFVCLIWFFTSHQQSFSYKGTNLPSTSTKLGLMCLAQGPSVLSQGLFHWATALPAVTWDFQQCDTCDQRGSDQPAQSGQSLWQLLEYSHELPKLKIRLHRLIWVYSCQNATLLEITCCGSCIDMSKLVRMWGGNEWMTQ